MNIERKVNNLIGWNAKIMEHIFNSISIIQHILGNKPEFLK